MYYLYSIDFPNLKRYIGITDNLSRRLAGYKTHARKGSTRQKVFSAIRKFGTETLQLNVLVVGEKDYIRKLERKAIEVYRTRDHQFGYNQALGGEMSPVAGIGHTEASKAKMSVSQKNRIRHPESYMKFATSMLGKEFSESHRKLLSECAKRRWAKVTERHSLLTLERIEKVKIWLSLGMKRREIATNLGLSKPGTHRLIVLAQKENPIIPEID